MYSRRLRARLMMAGSVYALVRAPEKEHYGPRSGLSTRDIYLDAIFAGKLI